MSDLAGTLAWVAIALCVTWAGGVIALIVVHFIGLIVLIARDPAGHGMAPTRTTDRKEVSTMRDLKFHPAGTSVQPAHTHAFSTEDAISGYDESGVWRAVLDVWLPTDRARRLAPSCPGCAWQVLVDDYVDARIARCSS